MKERKGVGVDWVMNVLALKDEKGLCSIFPIDHDALPAAALTAPADKTGPRVPSTGSGEYDPSA